jgi:hypothetical protein
MVSSTHAPGWATDAPGMPTPSPVIPTPVKSRSSARVLNWILAGALVLAVGGIAFAIGRMTAPAAAATTRGNFPGGAGGGGFTGNGYFGNRGNGNGGFGGFGGALGAGGVTVTGTVDSVSATTLTLKLASGQTVQIALDPSTTYHSQTNASASDIVTGGTVQVQLNLGRGGADGGPNASPGTATGPTARDITVVP